MFMAFGMDRKLRISTHVVFPCPSYPSRNNRLLAFYRNNITIYIRA